jgi:hypothetical protein
MAYIRTYETKQRSRGKPVKTYAVVYRATVRTDNGSTVTRLRQETHDTKAAAEARMAELNSHRYNHTADPSEQCKLGQRSLRDWAADWLASRRLKVTSGQLKSRTLDDYGRLLDRYVLPRLGHVPVAAVTLAQLDQLIADTTSKGQGGPSGRPWRSRRGMHLYQGRRVDHRLLRPYRPAPQASGPSGDLGLGTPISRPACDGTGIVVLASFYMPGRYESDVATMLGHNPGSQYLRTDQSCPSLRQSKDGNPIYAVYRLAGRTQGEVCAAVRAAGSGAYGKWLDYTTDPDYVIPC